MGEHDSLPDTLLHRATANAIWKPLRHALQDEWPIVTDWHNHDPRGNPHTSDYSPAGVPGVLPTYTAITETGRVLGRLEPKDWPGNGHILAAYLTETDYDMLAAQLTTLERYEWTASWTHSTARVPFLTDTNRHGNPTLRRNHDPRALITPLVADFLTALAATARVQLLTPAQEAMIELALLDDEAEVMNANEVFAIAQRSGIEEPTT